MQFRLKTYMSQLLLFFYEAYPMTTVNTDIFVMNLLGVRL